MKAPFRTRSRRGGEPLTADALAARDALVRDARWELVPIKSIEPAIAALAPASSVSVSCSPTKGVDATLEVVGRLLDEGHDAVAHVAARMVHGPEHTERIAAWCARHNARELFVVAGDAETPEGPYEGAAAFLRDFLDRTTDVAIGIAGYPDGHAFLPPDVQRSALHEKQALLRSAGVSGSISTQMCFDMSTVMGWAEQIRADGIELPIRFGVPGVVDRTRLLTLGARLGIGTSLRFLRKNRAAIGALVAPGGYDPTELVDALAGRASELGVTGLHVFTFNALTDTLAWADGILDAG
jgi:methylenetetrahydrofolate reductase (NADPH)